VQVGSGGPSAQGKGQSAKCKTGAKQRRCEGAEVRVDRAQRSKCKVQNGSKVAEERGSGGAGSGGPSAKGKGQSAKREQNSRGEAAKNLETTGRAAVRAGGVSGKWD
jgi:hypothetical protein